MATVVGVFRHSGDAQLAAEHLLEEYTLTERELDVLGPGDAWRLQRPAPPEYLWALASLSGVGLSGFPGEYEAVGHRFAGEALNEEKTLVVARTFDEEQARELAEELYRAGAEAVDIITDGTEV